MADQPRSKLELTPLRLQILAGVVLLLVITQIVGFVRTNHALDDARAAEWRAREAEARAINLENKVNTFVSRMTNSENKVNVLVEQINRLRAR